MRSNLKHKPKIRKDPADDYMLAKDLYYHPLLILETSYTSITKMIQSKQTPEDWLNIQDQQNAYSLQLQCPPYEHLLCFKK